MASFNPPTSQQGVTTTSLSHRTHWDQVGEAICPGAHKPGCWANRPCKVTALSIVSFSSFSLSKVTQLTCVSSCGLRCHWLTTNPARCGTRPCYLHSGLSIREKQPTLKGLLCLTLGKKDPGDCERLMSSSSQRPGAVRTGKRVGTNARRGLLMEHGMELYLIVAQRAHVLDLSSWACVCRLLWNRASRWVAVCSSTWQRVAHLAEMHQ